MDEHHDLLVYLPPMYKTQPGRRFSVLYMQDGQNLFDPETSFIKGNYWRMGETADALIEDDVIEPLIIVGIYNTGDRRIDEYTPVEDRRLGGGQADAYGRMLVEELKPFIDAQYRTLQGAEYCGMGGSSLGGLVTLYLGLRYPTVFSRLAVMSPSVWWRNRAILRTVASHCPRNLSCESGWISAQKNQPAPCPMRACCAIGWSAKDGSWGKAWPTSKPRMRSTQSLPGPSESLPCCSFFSRRRSKPSSPVDRLVTRN